jgi:hypothetical protein
VGIHAAWQQQPVAGVDLTLALHVATDLGDLAVCDADVRHRLGGRVHEAGGANH